MSTDEGDETKQRVSEVADLLHKQSPIELYRFLINPRDFGQTIENWFHFSFLIKDGRAKVSVGPGGVLVAGTLSAQLCTCVPLCACVERIESLVMQSTLSLPRLRTLTKAVRHASRPSSCSITSNGRCVLPQPLPPPHSSIDSSIQPTKSVLIRIHQNAIAMLGITEPVIPHRDYSRYAAEPLVGSKRASASQPTATTTTTSSSSSSSSTSRSRATASSSSSSQGNGRSRSSQHTDTDDESDQEEDAAVAQPSKRQRLMSAAR